MGWEIVFWNHTPFDLSKIGLNEIKLTGKPRPKTDLIKRAKIGAELDHFSKRFENPVYQTYKFPSSKKSIKDLVKNVVVRWIRSTHKNKKGLEQLRIKIKKSERKGDFYKICKEVLQTVQPDLVFCTNQRAINAVAPLTAAQDLGMTTSTFIFSWDNIPKATMVTETDYYFVWSDYMKDELISHYPHIKQEQIFICGTPQFEPNYNQDLIQPREKFFEDHGLDLSKDYICFSGDDFTTSPYDPLYLNDLAEAVSCLAGKWDLGIIFRRSPVDFSHRYNQVLEKYPDLIVPIEPKWSNIGGQWNSILPEKEDLSLLLNTIHYSKAVINVGSSMVFDFSILGKPCLYFNYDVEERKDLNWSIEKIYKFIHFSSMPTGEEVIWLNSKKEIPVELEKAIKSGKSTVEKASLWFQKINLPPAKDASRRMWNAINRIVSN